MVMEFDEPDGVDDGVLQLFPPAVLPPQAVTEVIKAPIATARTRALSFTKRLGISDPPAPDPALGRSVLLPVAFFPDAVRGESAPATGSLRRDRGHKTNVRLGYEPNGKDGPEGCQRSLCGCHQSRAFSVSASK